MSEVVDRAVKKEILMVKIDVSMTLAAAVDAHPAVAREFERRGLDYCCGGQRTLGDACALIGIDPETTVADIVAAVATSADAAAWTTM